MAQADIDAKHVEDHERHSSVQAHPTERPGPTTKSDNPAPTAGASSSPSQRLPSPAPYTVLSKWQKRYITATIYLPLISLLAQQYHTSVQAINLTITLYVLCQGLAPSFWSPLSDVFGRRPVFLATFAVYTAASLGLAFSGSSYVSLALLRAVQSIGGSAILSIAYGVITDISTHGERGSMLGPMLASGNLGPCIGPVVGGGAILASGHPRWCFWALVILGAACFWLVGWTFPETGRTVVGNGAVQARGIWRTWWDFSTEYRARCKGKLTFPNPFLPLRIIFYWDTFVILFLAASPYAVWYLVQTSIPIIYGRGDGGYGFDDLHVGLCYLAGGSGVIAGGVIAGRLMNWNYKHVAHTRGFQMDQTAGINLGEFPIEEARSRGSIIILTVSVCTIIGFGWAVQRKVHPAIPLILQCYIGAKCTVLHQMYSALLVDIFPSKPGTAAASNNITRCAVSAIAVACLQPLVSAMGRAWFFTLVAILDGVLCAIAVVALRRWGKHWRDGRN
ncbi:major facilitator superfamily domain-containing protein [Xylariales sp. AK1849]|nr:major facilitator superfamily domain-containing protein [Xylariales sp. AK1849]